MAGGVISTAQIFGLTVRESANDGSDFTNPGADYRRLFLGEDGGLHLRDSAGAITMVGVGAGSSFPSNPNTNDRFYRTDRGIEYYYDGTRWVSIQLFRDTFMGPESLVPATTTNTSFGRIATWGSQYDLWLVDFYTMLRVITTNNGTNYWTAALRKATAAASFTTIVTPDTSAQSINDWVHTRTSIGALLNNGTTHTFMDVNYAKVNAPGNLYAAAAVTYRLVG